MIEFATVLEIVHAVFSRRIKNIQLLNRRETLEYAINNNCSISRLGDGELDIVLHRKGTYFQRYDERLREKLTNILYIPKSNVLVCLDHEFMCSNKYYVVLDYERSIKKYYRYLSIFKTNDVAILDRKKQKIHLYFKLLLIGNKTEITSYGDATCFMLCFFYQDYLQKKMIEIIELYRKYFAKKKILFVCSDNPTLGVSFRKLYENGIIKSAKSIDFVVIPSKNCFDYYETILKQILSFRNIDAVFIQAGPTATVLVADLTTQYGLLSYDVGSWNVSLQKAADVHNITF